MDEKVLHELIERAARWGWRELRLPGENIASLPSDIGQLKNLVRFYLQENQLRSLPDEIGQLRNLLRLYLSRNQISSLPDNMGKLKNLTTLDLSGNQIGSLPAEIGKLKNLKRLYLEGNQLTDISDLMDLTKLKLLDLRRNRLSKLPRKILDLGMEIRWELENIDGIFLKDNPFEDPPVEIVKQGTEAVRNYFESIGSEEISHVYEAKLLIVGEGDVGKTCLMKRLMQPDKAINEKELSTEGIEINQWTIETSKSKNFRINFWDFGGQEIYHATHQFFLSKRSLYLFVWTARKDNDLTSFDYWLNVVKLLSDNSPVFVVLNKIDERRKSFDDKSLQEKFKNIKSFESVSALKGTGIEVLIGNIKQQIDQLPHIGDVLPKVWIDIRKRLEELDKNFISFDEYKNICSEFGLDEERAEFLSRYFHDLGVFLHFQDNAVLRDIVFLKPNWATNAVYKVVDTKEIQKKHGKFQFYHLKKIWDDYPEDKYAHLLELMKKFELCFQIPETQTYIVPELLKPSKPDFQWNYATNMRFEYRYDFMFAGIITRFIVRTNDIIKEEIYWKCGVCLEREDTQALIISDRLNRKISIWIRGQKKEELLSIIRREIDYIHKTLNCPNVREMIPCKCNKCFTADQPHFYEYNTLCKFRNKGKSRVTCQLTAEDVSIKTLLGSYERPEDERLSSIEAKEIHIYNSQVAFSDKIDKMETHKK